MSYPNEVPPVSAYAHWNEEAEQMWYAENRYDMEHADELAADREWERQQDDDRNFDEDEYERRVRLASTPDPDSMPCSFCDGGLAHYPECPEWPLR